ncbi:MAG: hypothetical protein FWD11_01445 [Micrococcales bacterium]|nr:hypothetical protein [Micrococcales bacterium]
MGATLRDNRNRPHCPALYGPTTEDDDTPWDWTMGGCNAEGNQVLEARQDTWVDPRTTVIGDFWDYAEGKVENDPRLRKATKKWSSCMSNKGYHFTTPEDAQDSIYNRFYDLMGVDMSVGGWHIDQAAVEQIAEEDIVALHDDEIATATADARCAITSGLTTATSAAWYDAEVEFYDSHKVEVDAWFDEQMAKKS